MNIFKKISSSDKNAGYNDDKCNTSTQTAGVQQQQNNICTFCTIFGALFEPMKPMDFALNVYMYVHTLSGKLRIRMRNLAFRKFRFFSKKNFAFRIFQKKNFAFCISLFIFSKKFHLSDFIFSKKFRLLYFFE